MLGPEPCGSGWAARPSETSGPDVASIAATFSEESVEKLLRAQETVNQRVLERARAVLSEAQLSAFAAFQTHQLQLMRMGMNMARKFMTPD